MSAITRFIGEFDLAQDVDLSISAGHIKSTLSQTFTQGEPFGPVTLNAGGIPFGLGIQDEGVTYVEQLMIWSSGQIRITIRQGPLVGGVVSTVYLRGTTTTPAIYYHSSSATQPPAGDPWGANDVIQDVIISCVTGSALVRGWITGRSL
jgi:hypothetical protein